MMILMNDDNDHLTFCDYDDNDHLSFNDDAARGSRHGGHYGELCDGRDVIRALIGNGIHHWYCSDDLSSYHHLITLPCLHIISLPYRITVCDVLIRE